MAKRTNLREFQQSLNDRMQDQTRKGSQLSLLGVEIAGLNYLVEMTDVSEVMPLPPLTAVPLTRPWFRGVANVRGNLYCVTDVAEFLNIGAATGALTNRLLLVAERHAVNAALLVGRVFGLRDTARWQRDASGQFFDEQGAAWRKLDVAGMLGRPEFLQIGI